MAELNKERVAEMAKKIRENVIKMTYEAQSGHPGGSFSMADVLSVLYFHTLNVDPKNPDKKDRDRVILSKGHGAPGWYAALAAAGFFAEDELWKLRRIDSLLQGHPTIAIPGVELTTGSLGLGLSGGCGMALAAKMDGYDNTRIYVIIGDGEQDEGQVWEAAMAAAHFKLDNLVAIADRNRYQNDGATEDGMALEPLADKWRAFGWHVIEVDGHDIEVIASAFEAARGTKGRPTMVIANTVKGFGASYMIDQPHLHYTPPTKEQMEQTLRDLGVM